MEPSTYHHQHVISIRNNGDRDVVADNSNNNEEQKRWFKLSGFSNKIHCSLVPVSSYLREKKRKKSEDDTKRVIHSIKVGVSLVLISLLYLLDPLYNQVGDNAMWSIMTVVVLFEFYAGSILLLVSFLLLQNTVCIISLLKYLYWSCLPIN